MKISTAFSIALIAFCACVRTPSSPPETRSEHNKSLDPFKAGAKLDPNYLLKGYEGQPCAPEKGSITQQGCNQGLVCVPSIYKPEQGSCRKSCGDIKDSIIVKNQQCPAGRTCQALSLLDTKAQLGAFCMEMQLERNGLCAAEGDDQACAYNRSCLAVKNEKGIRSHLLCKEVCDSNTHSCNYAGESCVRDENSDSELCVEWVQWTSIKDLPKVMLTGEGACHEKMAHAFCDRSLFEGLNEPPILQCFNESEEAGGLCLAACSVPHESTILRLECPIGYSCSPAMGLLIDQGAFYKSPEKNIPKTCQLGKCEKGKPCPGECEGSEDSFCRPMEGLTEIGMCWIPFGFCNKEVA